MKIDTSKMKEWRKMEAEHTKDPKKQERIVIQHIKEHGFGYYPALKRMENKLDKRRR